MAVKPRFIPGLFQEIVTFWAGKGNRKWLFSTRNSGFPCSRIPDGQARKEGERGMRTEAHKPPEMLQQAGPGIRSAFFMATPRRL